MSIFKWFASFVLAAAIVPALPAEPHCLGNVASVPLHLTNSHQMIVGVSVNHSGPTRRNDMFGVLSRWETAFRSECWSR